MASNLSHWAALAAFLVASAVGAQTRAVRIVDDPTDGKRVELQELLRIGSLSGTDAFGRIMDVALGTGGRLYIADDLNHRVSVYGVDGKLIRQVGNRGQGPGEFESPWELAVDPADSLFVWDVSLKRVTVFGPDLQHVRSFPLPPFWLVNGLEFLPDGRLLVSAYDPTSFVTLHIIDRKGKQVRDFGPILRTRGELVGFESSLLGGTIDVQGARILYSSKSPYELHLFDVNGRPRITCQGEASWTSRPQNVIAADAEKQTLRWATYIHSARAIALAENLFLNVILNPTDNTRTIDLLDDRCRLLRRTVVKAPLMLIDYRDGRIAGVRSLEYPEVVLYRVRVM